MKFHRSKVISFIFLVAISLSLVSCSDNSVNNTPGPPFQIEAWDYSDNHYFLDTIYKQSFENFYNDLNLNSQTINYQINENNFEVWVQTDQQSGNYRIAASYIDLPVLPHGGIYDDSLKHISNPEPGKSIFGYVRKLESSEYILNKFAGYVSLRVNLPTNWYATVAYKLPERSEQYGTISVDSTGPSDTLILKMIKVQNLIPNYNLAWNLKLKNIYTLPVKNVSENGFDFNISYLRNGVYSESFPGISLKIISIVGLDKYTYNTYGISDGNFDFIPGKTIDTENGWIIFPRLKPFLTDLQNYNYNGEMINPDDWYPEIYYDLKSNTRILANSKYYILWGNASGE